MGLDSVDEDLLIWSDIQCLKASDLSQDTNTKFASFVFSGLKVSATMTVVGTIVGEFVASSKGLGYLIKDSQAMMNTPPMFAALFLVSAIGLGLFAFIGSLEVKLMPWNRGAEAKS